MTWLTAVHFAATAYMTGVIWTVQGVHYPMLGRVGASFEDCQRFHMSRITLIVGGAMLIEALTALMLLMMAPGDPIWWLGLALLGGIWISTFSLQVPRHDRLACAFDAGVYKSLVRTNWIRTVLWTLRLLLTGWAAI